MGIESRSDGLATDTEGMTGNGRSPGPKVERCEPVLREKGSWGDREAVDKVEEGLLQAMVSRPEDCPVLNKDGCGPGCCETCLKHWDLIVCSRKLN